MRSALLAMALIALGACDRPERDPEPAPNPSPSPTRDKASIIRDDVGIERETPASMTPLAVRIGFEAGGAELTEAAVVVLEEALASPQMKAGGRILLSGHSDSAGGDEANLRASRRRAEAVRDWLLARGVSEERITVVAFGEQNPVVPNARPDGTPDEAGRTRNRRVELTVALPAGTRSAADASEDDTLVEELTQTE